MCVWWRLCLFVCLFVCVCVSVCVCVYLFVRMRDFVYIYECLRMFASAVLCAHL